MLNGRDRAMRCVAFERVESRHCLSALTYVETRYSAGLSDISGEDFTLMKGMFAFDVDDDGDMDVVGGITFDHTVWFENTDAGLNLEEPRISNRDNLLYNGFYEAANAHTDIDGDGDLDILIASPAGLGWLENVQSPETLNNFRVIRRMHVGHSAVFSDLDGDADVDILVPISDGGGLEWYRNDGDGSFDRKVVFRRDRAAMVYRRFDVADVDGDDDLDVVTIELDEDPESNESAIYWYENSDGLGTFGPRRLLTHASPDLMQVSDIDGDGDDDLLLQIEDVEEATWGTAWLENQDGQGRFDGPLQWIPSRNDLDNNIHWIVLDRDGDGDQDILASTRDIRWYENLDGAQVWASHTVVDVDAEFGFSAPLLFDPDGDGDLDILHSCGCDAYDLVFLENRVIGDSNDDGVFSSPDLIESVAHGKYETEADATFDEGDWNQDGQFTSDDLVHALAAGHYETG